MLYSEQRSGKRKILKVKALLMMEGAQTVLGRTLDVAGDGLCMLMPVALPAGAIGTVRFEIFHEGKAISISARARAQYCILRGGEYKVGFQFVNLELSAMASLSRFLQ